MDYLLEVTENLIWHEFCMTYCYNRKIRAYIDRRRKFNRWSNWFVIGVSLVASISYWKDTTCGAIFSGIAAIALLLKELMPLFNQPESELMELHNAATFYAQYQSEMEKLFVALKYHHVHPSFLQDDFFSQKKMAAKYLAITNDFYRGLPSKIETNIHNEFDEYVREIYP